MSTPGWQPDPTGRHEYRYWDGTQWLDDVADGGTPSVDPMAATPPPTAAVPEPIAPQPQPQPQAPPPEPAQQPGYYPGTVQIPDLDYGDDDNGGRHGGGGGLSTGLLVALGVLVLALAGGILFVLLNQDSGDDTADQPTTTTVAPTTTAAAIGSGQLVQEFADAIAAGSDGRFTAEQAHCMATGILEAIGLERLAEVRIESQKDATKNPVDLLTDDEQEKAYAAMRECVPAGELNQVPSSG